MTARLSGAHAARIHAWGAPAAPALKALLTDPDRYVAAHVLLSWVVPGTYSISGDEYHHLVVHVSADDTIAIPDQRRKLCGFWRVACPKLGARRN